MPQRISIIGTNGCTASVLMGAVDYFAIANILLPGLSLKKKDAFKTQIVSPNGHPVTCSNGYSVSVDGDLNAILPGDVVICLPFAMTSPGKFISTLKSWQPLTKWLYENAKLFELLVATGSGVFLLAEAGLLRDKTASTAWWFDQLFRERYPGIRVDSKSHYIINDNIMCSGLPNAWPYACLSIIERYVGKSFAITMSNYLMLDYEHRVLAPQAFISKVQTANPIVNKADMWIQRNLANPINTENIAKQISVSPRTLIRHFQTSLNMSPKTYIQNTRLKKCQLLLEISDMTFSEISNKCGYKDESSFRRLFKNNYFVSPTQYRKKFREEKNRLRETNDSR